MKLSERIADKEGRIALFHKHGPVEVLDGWAKDAAALEEELEENEQYFELRHKADMRAIERWRQEPWPEGSSKTPKEFVLPDQADLCIWLLGKLREQEQEVERLKSELAKALDPTGGKE